MIVSAVQLQYLSYIQLYVLRLLPDSDPSLCMLELQWFPISIPVYMYDLWVMQLFDLNSRFHICMSFLAVLCYQISCTCMFTALLFWSRFHTHICILLYCFYPAFMHRYACSSAVLVQISYMYMHIVHYFSISYTYSTTFITLLYHPLIFLGMMLFCC